jgi:hypothetical protein
MKKGICFVVAILAFSSAMLAQTATPPVKMGLWQTTNVGTVSGIQIPPDVAARLQAMGRPLPTMGQPHTSVVQSCLTPESWKKMFADMQQDHDCTFTHQQQSSTGLSADMACKSDRGRSTGHVDMSFVSSEKMHGKAHIEVITERQPNPIVMDMHFDSVYQGADCQGVTPGDAKVIH